MLMARATFCCAKNEKVVFMKMVTNKNQFL